MKNNKKLFVILIFIIIIIVFIAILVSNKLIYSHNNLIDLNNSTVENNVSYDTNNETISPIPLNVGEIKSVTGGELISINDYKILIPMELVQIGYDIINQNNVLQIKAKNNSYECIILQLSDNYNMPTEKEIDAFYQLPEYKELYEGEYNSSEYSKEYDKLKTEYYKSLGYTAKNSPDYVLTKEEKENIIGKYILDGEIISSYSNGLFPGYETCHVYDWGKTTLFTIPKYYNDSRFGENFSEFSLCMYMFQYYNVENINFDIDLWQF